MEKYLTELIDRMLDKSDQNMIPFDSSKTISWKALREAEKIDNKNYIPQLIDFIDNAKEKDKRNKACFILGHIAKNTKDNIATHYLISRIDKEADKYVISSLLDRIQYLDKPIETDLSPIINATKSKIWQIRHSAIQALKFSNNKIAEKTLLDIIATSDNEYDLIYANWTLSNIGTIESIPFLLKLVNHRKQDVSGTALGAILALSNESSLPLFIEQLEKGKNKLTALLGVIKYGDEKVMPHIVKRVKQLVNKKRSIMVIGGDGKTEIIFSMDFLINYVNESPEPKRLYEFLTAKKQDILWDSEKKWLEQNRLKFEK